MLQKHLLECSHLITSSRPIHPVKHNSGVTVSHLQRACFGVSVTPLARLPLSRCSINSSSMSDGTDSNRKTSSSSMTTTTTKTSMRRIRVYTRTGDKGTAQLYNLERRSKTDPVFDALGDTDELNAYIGVVSSICTRSTGTSTNNARFLLPRLKHIQSRLLDIGSAIATPLSSEKTREDKAQRVQIDCTEHTKLLEQWIDEMDSKLPPLSNFILPSGGEAASTLHVCRSVCRRAERKIVAIGTDDVDPSVFAYVNRLSDFFFVAARFAAMNDGMKETVYQKSSDSDPSFVDDLSSDFDAQMGESDAKELETESQQKNGDSSSSSSSGTLKSAPFQLLGVSFASIALITYNNLFRS